MLPERARAVRPRAAAGSGLGQRALDPTTYDPYGPYFILLADLAGDHRAQAVVLYTYPGIEVMGQRSAPEPVAADVADIDGDGHLDVVVASYFYGVVVHPGAGDGYLRVNPLVYTYAPLRAELVDINRDGVKDVAEWSQDRG